MTLPKLVGHRLAGQLVEQRLGVEQVDVARPALHEQEDDALRRRGEVRRLRREARRAPRRVGRLAGRSRAAASRSMSARAPKPAPPRSRKSRRVAEPLRDAGRGTCVPVQRSLHDAVCGSGSGSVDVQEFVRVQEHVAEVDQRRPAQVRPRLPSGWPGRRSRPWPVESRKTPGFGLEPPVARGCGLADLVGGEEQLLRASRALVREPHVVDQPVEPALILAAPAADASAGACCRSPPAMACGTLATSSGSSSFERSLRKNVTCARSRLPARRHRGGGVVGPIELDVLVGEDRLLAEVPRALFCRRAAAPGVCGLRRDASPGDPERPAGLLHVAVPLRDDRPDRGVLGDRVEQEERLDGEVARVQRLVGAGPRAGAAARRARGRRPGRRGRGSCRGGTTRRRSPALSGSMRRACSRRNASAAVGFLAGRASGRRRAGRPRRPGPPRRRSPPIPAVRRTPGPGGASSGC